MHMQERAPLPVLKIKLPAGIVKLKRAPPPSDGGGAAPVSQSQSRGHAHALPAKKRGRPTKEMVAARAALAGPSTPLRAARPRAPAPSTNSAFMPNSKKKAPLGRGTTGKHLNKKKQKTRRRLDGFGEDDSDELSDMDVSGQFPTFVSASAVSSSDLSGSGSSASSDSGSDSDSTAGFGTDSSVEKEEEDFIIAETHRPRRARREHLHNHHREGGGGNGNGRWEIKPRKKSVGPSDQEMDVDSDSDGGGSDTDDEDEDEDEDADAEKEGDADEEEGAGAEDDGEATDAPPARGYAGIATGWSDDEEDTFDADLFFANLSSSSGSDDDDDDEDAAAPLSAAAAPDDDVEMAAAPLARSHSYEFRTAWGAADGVFAPGLDDAAPVPMHLLDLDFQFPTSTTAPSTDASECPSTSDDREPEHEHASAREGSDDDSASASASDGATTEDDFVDAAGLPTPRAMMLFRWPAAAAASTVNPLSTVSPGVRRPPPTTTKRNPRASAHAPNPHAPHAPAPRPADILAGRVFLDESEDERERDDGWARARRPSVSSRGGGPPAPRMGEFVRAPAGARSVVIDGSQTADAAPSPFPRRRRRAPRRPHPHPHPHRCITEVGRPRAPSSPRSPVSALQSSDPDPTTDSIELDDVLDASILADRAPSPAPSLSLSPCDDGADAIGSGSGMRSLSRWALIPMGAFRQAREEPAARAHAPVPASATDPFDSLMWQARAAAGGDMLALPLPLPAMVPERDGDRTPQPRLHPHPHDRTPSRTPSPRLAHPRARTRPQHAAKTQAPAELQSPSKTRKESRQEKRLKRRLMSLAPAPAVRPHHAHQHQHQHYHAHQHHANGKARAAGAVQRTAFFGGSPAGGA
jgi:hypothetical protein